MPNFFKKQFQDLAFMGLVGDRYFRLGEARLIQPKRGCLVLGGEVIQPDVRGRILEIVGTSPRSPSDNLIIPLLDLLVRLL